jgi:hypothetical protein
VATALPAPARMTPSTRATLVLVRPRAASVTKDKGPGLSSPPADLICARSNLRAGRRLLLRHVARLLLAPEPRRKKTDGPPFPARK